MGGGGKCIFRFTGAIGSGKDAIAMLPVFAVQGTHDHSDDGLGIPEQGRGDDHCDIFTDELLLVARQRDELDP